MSNETKYRSFMDEKFRGVTIRSLWVESDGSFPVHSLYGGATLALMARMRDKILALEGELMELRKNANN